MIDFKRYLGLLVVAGGMLCAYVFCNVLLNVTFGKDPAIFNDPEKKIVLRQLQNTGESVAGVELQTRHRDDRDPEPFNIILGQSTTFYGVDPRLLTEEVVPHHQWLLLNGFGGSFVKLRLYVQPLTASKLQPDTIVLGLHATMLVGQGAADQDEAERQGPTNNRARKRRAAKARWWPMRRLQGYNWVSNQRDYISHHANLAFFLTRLALHEQLHSGAVGLFHPSSQPWQPITRKELPERQPDQYLQRQYNGWTQYRWFEADSYATTGRHADAFRDLITALDALGPRQIVIVNMPFSSSLRGWIPPESKQVFHELIDEVSAGRNILVIEMQDAMPDDAFSDYAHLNPAGREVFSRLLAEKINELNKNQ